MNLFEPHLINEKNLKKTEIESIIDKEKEYKLVNSIRKIPGLTLFGYNTKTKELFKVKITSKAELTLDGEILVKNHTMFEEHCIYVQALNEKNAWKKINKQL